MKNRIHILYTLPEKSRYLDDIPYSIWFIDDNKIYYTSICFNNFEFDNLMNLELSAKYDFLKSSIEIERESQKIWEIEIEDINISTMDNEKELKMGLTRALREYKLNQIIKK